MFVTMSSNISGIIVLFAENKKAVYPLLYKTHIKIYKGS